MKKSYSISWNIPFAVHRADAIRELSVIFSPAVLMRIVLAFIAVFIGAFYASQRYLPELEFDWIMAFLKCAGVLVVILAMCCAISFAPPSITVTPKGITVFQGQSSRLHLFNDLVECRITEEREGFSFLVFRRRDQNKIREFAVSPKIKLDELSAMLDAYKRKW
jgi:hypothetical protein